MLQISKLLMIIMLPGPMIRDTTRRYLQRYVYHASKGTNDFVSFEICMGEEGKSYEQFCLLLFKFLPWVVVVCEGWIVEFHSTNHVFI